MRIEGSRQILVGQQGRRLADPGEREDATMM